jgi:O-methyltransferase
MYTEIITKVSPWVLGNLAHMEQTAEIAEQACKLEGDMCECGCYHGGMSSIMGYVCQKNNKEKKIFLYDSFEGIPFPTIEDTIVPGHPKGVSFTGELKTTGVSVANIPTLLKVLEFSEFPMENYIVTIGWVQNSLPLTSMNINKLSFLRIDVDLYAPTKLCLQTLYDKVVPGGYVLVHDMLPGCLQAIKEFQEVHPEIQLQPCRDDGGYFWIK